jgi:hypothetical protein
MTMIEAGGRVFVYEPFGYKLDRLKECGQSVSGGVYALDPSSGNVIAHLSPSLYFMRVVAGADGGELYGIDVRGPKRLIKLDSRTGMILVERMLDQDVSSLALAKIPESILPLEEVAVNSCRQQP